MRDLIEWLLREEPNNLGFVDCETECIRDERHIPELCEACIVVVEDFSENPHVSEIYYLRNSNVEPCFKKWSTIDQNVVNDKNAFRRALTRYSDKRCLIEYSVEGFDRYVLSKYFGLSVNTECGIYVDSYGDGDLGSYYLEIELILKSKFNYEYVRRRFFGKYLHLFEINRWHTAIKDALALAFSFTMHFHLFKSFKIDLYEFD